MRQGHRTGCCGSSRSSSVPSKRYFPGSRRAEDRVPPYRAADPHIRIQIPHRCRFPGHSSCPAPLLRRFPLPAAPDGGRSDWSLRWNRTWCPGWNPAGWIPPLRRADPGSHSSSCPEQRYHTARKSRGIHPDSSPAGCQDSATHTGGSDSQQIPAECSPFARPGIPPPSGHTGFRRRGCRSRLRRQRRKSTPAPPEKSPRI